MCQQKGIGVVFFERTERGLCIGRVELGGLLSDGGCHDLRSPPLLDGVASGTAREGVSPGQVIWVFSCNIPCVVLREKDYHRTQRVY